MVFCSKSPRSYRLIIGFGNIAALASLAMFSGCKGPEVNTPTSSLREPVDRKPERLSTLLDLPAPPQLGAAARALSGIKLIDAKVVRSFPHLDPYGGNLVLLSRTMQVVVPGRSLDGIRGVWHPLISAVFQFENSRWQPVAALQDVQAHILSRTPLRFSGIDLSQEGRHLTAAMIFDRNNSGRRFGVGVVIDTEQNLIGIGEFGRSPSQGDTSDQGLTTLIRMVTSSDITTYTTAGGQSSGENLERVAFDRGTSTAIFGGRTSRQFSGAIVLNPLAATTFMVGRSETTIGQIIPDLVGECTQKGQPIDIKAMSMRFVAAIDCALERVHTRSALVALDIPEDQSDSTSVQARPLFVANAVSKQTVLRAMGRPGETFNLRLPLGGRYSITDAFDSTNEVDLDLSQPPDSSPLQAFLPPRSWGEVDIHPKSDKDELYEDPAIVRIALVRKDLAPLLDSEVTDLPKVGTNSFLVKRWPTSVELPEGNYRFTIINEATGFGCAQMVTVEEGASEEIDCVMTPDGYRERTDAFRLVDGNSAEEDFTDDWRAVTGAGIINLPLTADESSAELAAATAFDGLISQSYTVTAPLTRISVRAFPVSRNFVDRWERYWEKHSDLDLPATFAKFTRQFAPDALVELGCPGTEQSVTHFVRVFDRVEPDLLKYYSCPMVKNHPRLASKLLSRLVERVTVPPALTFDSQGAAPLAPATPALEFSQHQFKDVAKENLARKFTDLMRNGSYRFTQGASAVRSIDTNVVNQSPVLVGQRKGMSIIDDQLKVRLQVKMSKLRVIIYSEQGAIASAERMPKSTNQEMAIDIQAQVRQLPKFVRYEIYGYPSNGKNSVDSPVLLAGTNFYPVRSRSP